MFLTDTKLISREMVLNPFFFVKINFVAELLCEIIKFFKMLDKTFV